MTATHFIARIESNRALLAAIAAMYAEGLPSHPDPQARNWREQLAALIDWYGRAVVIDALVEAVEGLTVREAMALADLAGRAPSGLVEAVT